ncbi:DUF2975 domain-containing protein [Pectobacterium sp. B1J-3]|uniref:DUF2975 domain-containing protein n=1 Tax=Pectobacterium sp. B1J-3 TaxID=3385371 RepID=UPI00390606C8
MKFLSIRHQGLCNIVEHDSPRYGKSAANLRRLASVLLWVLGILSMLILIAPFIIWFGFSDESLQHNLAVFLNVVNQPTPLFQLSFPNLVVGSLLTFGIALLLANMLLQVMRVCMLVRKGLHLTIRASHYLKRLALSVIVLGMSVPLLKTILAYWLTVGQGRSPLLLVSIDLGDILMLLAGCFLFVLAWAMREAAYVAEENSQFI